MEDNSILRNRIWLELVTLKFYSEFIELFIKFNNQLDITIKACFAVFSVGGIATLFISQFNPSYIFIIILLLSIADLIKALLVLDNSTMITLVNSWKFYNKYYNEYESVWINWELNRINDEEVKSFHYEFKKEENNIFDNTIAIKIHPKFLVKKAKKRADEYFIEIFNAEKNE